MRASTTLIPAFARCLTAAHFGFPMPSMNTGSAPSEAMHFSCNAVVIERDIVLPEGAPELVTTLQERGYRCYELPMSEFIKAGGACKCLTMFMPQRERLD